MNYSLDNFSRDAYTNMLKDKNVSNDISSNLNPFQDFHRQDFSTVNFNAEQDFRYKAKDNKKDVRPFVGSLPFRTTPMSKIMPTHRMIPESTRVSRVCFNDALEQSGPFYLRQWPIWDHLPFLPSTGDVSKDPRYGQQTKGFTTEYKQMM